MDRSGFNYNAPSFLGSARHRGFWSHARLVSESVHRQYRLHDDPPILQQSAAGTSEKISSGPGEAGIDEIQERAAA